MVRQSQQVRLRRQAPRRRQAPDAHARRYFWVSGKRSPSCQLEDYVTWIEERHDADRTQMTLRCRVSSEVFCSNDPQLVRSKAKVKKEFASAQPCEKCTDFSRAGANKHVDVWTCRVCGAQTKQKKVLPGPIPKRNDCVRMSQTLVAVDQRVDGFARTARMSLQKSLGRFGSRDWLRGRSASARYSRTACSYAAQSARSHAESGASYRGDVS
jgi:ribosomal protein L37AE/L43A